MRPCQRLGCGTVATIRVGWVPASAFRDSEEAGYAVDRLWFRGCDTHSREVWLMRRDNRQSPVWVRL